MNPPNLNFVGRRDARYKRPIVKFPYIQRQLLLLLLRTPRIWHPTKRHRQRSRSHWRWNLHVSLPFLPPVPFFNSTPLSTNSFAMPSQTHPTKPKPHPQFQPHRKRDPHPRTARQPPEEIPADVRYRIRCRQTPRKCARVCLLVSSQLT